jgi:hypothetical protein
MIALRPSRRGPLALGLLLSTLALPLLLGALASRARAGRDERALGPVMRVLPWPDLALGGGARHLRSLSLEEPWAAFADAPGALDPEPAGGSLAPPAAVWAQERALGGPR